MPEFRIGDYNYLFDSTVGIEASSEDASFPASNLADFSLAKYWRSSYENGTFVIDSTNKKIDFKESGGGAELNAVITEGTYTATELAAAIKSALEDAGAETYTVTYSSTTGKWTIASAGSYLSLLWSSGTNTATAAHSTIGFPVTDYTGAVTYTGSQIAIHTVERVVVDLRSAQDIDSFAAIWGKGDAWKMSEEAVVKLKGSATNSWASPGVSVTLAFDELYNVLTHFFASAQSYRYWCIEIVDPRNPFLYVELPKLFLTKATQLTQVPQIGMAISTKDRSRSMETDYGHRFTDVYPALGIFEFKYAALSATDLATLEEIFERVGSAAPIFIALDSTGSVYDKDRFFMYGYLNDELKRSNVFYTYFDTGLQLVEAQ